MSESFNLDWFERSQLGECCGVVNCPRTPISECPRCGNWYCSVHFPKHFHKEEVKS